MNQTGAMKAFNSGFRLERERDRMIVGDRTAERRSDPWIDLGAAVVRQAVQDYGFLCRLGAVRDGRRVVALNEYRAVARGRRAPGDSYTAGGDVDTLLRFLFGGGVEEWAAGVLRLPPNMSGRLRRMMA